MLIIPYSLAFFIGVLYVLRFNLTLKPKIVPDPDNIRIEERVEEKEEINEEITLIPGKQNEKNDEPIYTEERNYLHVPWENKIFRVFSVVSVTIIVPLSAILCIVLFFVYLGVFAGFSALLWVLAFAFLLFKRYDKDASQAQTVFFWILLGLMLFIFVIGNLQQPEIEKKAYGGIGTYYPREQTPYAVCNMKWNNMTIADYGFFAHLAYTYEPYFTQDFKTLFPNCTDCYIAYTYNASSSFYDIHMPSKNLSVVGVRGTLLLVDFIQDFFIWKEIALLQFSSFFGPFVAYWPESMTTLLIEIVSFVEKTIEDETAYYTPLEEYIKSIKSKRNVIMTGHSLGGGIVNIVGARQDVQSIAFSPPGVYFSRQKLGLQSSSVNRLSVNVIPDKDIVTKIDRNLGFIQNIDCDGMFAACHSLQRTVMSLIKSCGSDEMGRFLH